MAKARKLPKEFRQLLLFDRAPVDRRAPPFLVDLPKPEVLSNDPAEEVANFFAAGLMGAAVSQVAATTPDDRVLISPAVLPPLLLQLAELPGAATSKPALRSSGFIRRNRSKKPVAAPSLDFLCGTDGDGDGSLDGDDDENDESSSCYVALGRMIDRQAKGKKKSAGDASRGDSRSKPPAIDPYDLSDDFDDEDPDGLRLQLSPEQLARMEEVHRSWKPKQAKKRNMNYRPPMGVVEVETHGVLESGPRKRRMSDDPQ